MKKIGTLMMLVVFLAGCVNTPPSTPSKPPAYSEKKVDKISVYIKKEQYTKAYQLMDELRIGKKEREKMEELVDLEVQNKLSEQPKKKLKKRLGAVMCSEPCTKEHMVQYLLKKLKKMSGKKQL